VPGLSAVHGSNDEVRSTSSGRPFRNMVVRCHTPSNANQTARRPCQSVGREKCFRYLGETGPLSQGVQARRKALRIRHINSMEVRK
jgi:hypothetical protein